MSTKMYRNEMVCGWCSGSLVSFEAASAQEKTVAEIEPSQHQILTGQNVSSDVSYDLGTSLQ